MLVLSFLPWITSTRENYDLEFYPSNQNFFFDHDNYHDSDSLDSINSETEFQQNNMEGIVEGIEDLKIKPVELPISGCDTAHISNQDSQMNPHSFGLAKPKEYSFKNEVIAGINNRNSLSTLPNPPLYQEVARFLLRELQHSQTQPQEKTFKNYSKYDINPFDSVIESYETVKSTVKQLFDSFNSLTCAEHLVGLTDNINYIDYYLAILISDIDDAGFLSMIRTGINDLYKCLAVLRELISNMEVNIFDMEGYKEKALAECNKFIFILDNLDCIIFNQSEMI